MDHLWAPHCSQALDPLLFPSLVSCLLIFLYCLLIFLSCFLFISCLSPHLSLRTAWFSGELLDRHPYPWPSPPWSTISQSPLDTNGFTSPPGFSPQQVLMCCMRDSTTVIDLFSPIGESLVSLIQLYIYSGRHGVFESIKLWKRRSSFLLSELCDLSVKPLLL